MERNSYINVPNGNRVVPGFLPLHPLNRSTGRIFIMKKIIQKALRFFGYSLHRSQTVETLLQQDAQYRRIIGELQFERQLPSNDEEALNIADNPDIEVGPEFSSVGLSDAALQALILNYDFETVIDIGAGAQVHSEVFARFGKRVTAVDLGKSKFHRQKSKNNSENVNEIFGDFNTLEFSEKFDCVWASHVLEHQLDVNLFLSKILSILKEGGVLAITVPPLKNEIVGGHVSLWNAGLVLYRLVLAGIDCSKASILSYGYNISVIVRKHTINTSGIELDFDAGDIRRLKKYFPPNLTFNSNELDDPFDGQISRLNWPDIACRDAKPRLSHFYDRSLAERQEIVNNAIRLHETLVARWETLASEYTDSWSLRAQRAVSMMGDIDSVADVGCGMMTLERYLPSGVSYVPMDVVRRDDRTIVVDLNKEKLPMVGTECLVALGLLEYIFDVPALLKQMSNCYDVVVTSYNSTDNFPDLNERTGHAWVNAYAIAEIESLFIENGFIIEDRVQHDGTQTMWRLRGVQRCRAADEAPLKKVQRIVFTCDFLRTDELQDFNQHKNITKIYELMAPALGAATPLPLSLFPLDNGEEYRKILNEVYGYFDLTPSIENWAKIYHASSVGAHEVSEALLLNSLRPAFEGAVVIAFEASPLLQRLLSKIAVAFIDVRAHCERFLDDLPLAFRSNSIKIENAMSQYRLSREVVRNRVGEIRALLDESYVPAKAVVFFVQTVHDSSVIKPDGSFFDVRAYLESIQKIVRSYGAETLLVKPHPLEPNNEVVNALMSLPMAEITSVDSYNLMQAGNVVACMAFSSSAGHEATAFGKPVHWLSLTRPIEKYIPIMFEYRNPQFWSDILLAIGARLREPQQGTNVEFRPNFLRNKFGINWDAASKLSRRTPSV